MNRLEEIRARCEAARPVVYIGVPMRAESRRFLESAKTDMMYLLAEIERLKLALTLSKAREHPVDIFPELTPQQRAENKEIVELTEENANLREYEKLYQGICDKHQQTHRKVMEAYKAMTARAEKAEASNRWVPVSEGLPEKEVSVLIACKNGAVFVAEYKGTDYELRKIWSVKGPLGTGRHVASSRVTHWSPLPEPPKGE